MIEDKNTYTPLDIHEVYIKKPSSQSCEEKSMGEALLRKGKVGTIVMAGGSGSRLGWKGPKGTFPVTLIKQKSMYQYLAEKTHFASIAYGSPLHIAFMTSIDNDMESKQFFYEHNNFGLHESQINFYSQDSLPLLDVKGHPLLDDAGKPITGPNGNGKTLLYFVTSGLFHRWKKLGIEFVTVLCVDNPLIDPFDAELIGFHANSNREVTVKAILREKAEEPIGCLVKTDGSISVVEYSELSYDEKSAKTATGALKHPYGNISFFCFSMDFIEQIAGEQNYARLHSAQKQLPQDIAEKFHIEQQRILKKEYFIFDLLRLSRKVAVVVDQRACCFAPLKNASGTDSITTVQELLLQRDRALFEQISGTKIESALLELSPAFYYPTQELLQRWSGRMPTASYIEDK